jgi:hypothetical protein
MTSTQPGNEHRGSWCDSVEESDGLDAGDFESLPATHILAHQHVVFAQHVRTCFGKARAVALIGASGKLPFFGTDDPEQFVFLGLVTMRTIQSCRFFFGPLVKKISLFHRTNFGRQGSRL